MGIASSRISPESSVRGHGMYTSEYRNYIRGGFGRGQQKQFQPPPIPQPIRRGDVFMEAGRLATQYLVSKGVLSPAVLSGKWQNGNLKSQMEELQGFRPPQHGDSSQISPEIRGPALSRLGEADVGAGKRRYSDEFDTVGSRDYARGRRRVGGSFKEYGSELNREMGRSRSWSEKGRSDLDSGDDDKVSDTVEQSLQKTEFPLKSLEAGDSKTSPNTVKNTPVETELKSGDSSAGKEITDVAIVDVTDQKDDLTINEEEKQNAAVELPVHKFAEEVNLVSKDSNDLLKDSRFANVPTRIRSSLTSRGSRIDPVLITEDDIPKECGTSIDDVSVEGSSATDAAASHQTTIFAETENSKESSEQIITEGSFMNDQKSNDEPPGFGGWNIVVKPAADEKEPGMNLENPVDITMYPESESEQQQQQQQQIDYAEEKQLFPCSFKICDLNLMESSDVNENHRDSSPVLMFPSIPLSQKSATPVEIGLSMSTTSCRDVEVIDLESDSMQQDRDFDTSITKDETVFTGLDNFPSHPQNVSEIPDVQDGYGLMISELLGNDMTNCGSVNPDVNSLQNEMVIHNEEEILGDDDPIYMSLGEIPISMPEI
jgi:hypothetical protein